MHVLSCFSPSVEDVKTRAVSLLTLYCRLLKPKPSGNGNKPMMSRQKWLLRIIDFIKSYIVHHPCETTVSYTVYTKDHKYVVIICTDYYTLLKWVAQNVSVDYIYSFIFKPVSLPSVFQLGVLFSEQGDAEDHDLSESRPDTPPAASTSYTLSSLESSNERGSPTAFRETALTASTDSSAQKVWSTRKEKRKRMSEKDIELQKLEVLKKMAAKVDAEPTPDTLTAFGNQVVLEIRLIQDPVQLSRLKKSIMIMIYDSQETERNRSLSSQAQHRPSTFQPVISALPTAQS